MMAARISSNFADIGDRVSIHFNDITVYVRNGEFSHDVAIALQAHFNRQHEQEYSKPKILAEGNIPRGDLFAIYRK